MKTPIGQAVHDIDFYATTMGLTKAQKTLVKEWLETYLPAQRLAITEAYKDGAKDAENYGDVPKSKYREPNADRYFNDKYDE